MISSKWLQVNLYKLDKRIFAGNQNVTHMADAHIDCCPRRLLSTWTIAHADSCLHRLLRR